MGMSILADRFYWTCIPELDRLPPAMVSAAQAMDDLATKLDRLWRQIALMQDIERRCAGQRRRQMRRRR